jgi:hypothetical protein
MSLFTKVNDKEVINLLRINIKLKLFAVKK